ncbi:hypothetical protein NC652_016511 [Populus alba x Populus x berolinensis]|nr:hypothetical protein NC652_016511 [Populus alba x Populus x berolinensis]
MPHIFKNNSNNQQRVASEIEKKTLMGAEQKEGAKAEAKKKPAADAGEKKDVAKVISVYKLDIHCEGCAKKIRHAVKHLEGVEGLKTDCAGNKLTVTGKVDPAKIKARLEDKTERKVEILSPQPKKDDGAAAGGGDKKADKKSEGKKEEAKKPPPESTVVLKFRLHCENCEGCISNVEKIISKIKGVRSVTVDAEKNLVTVKGTMDVKDLAPCLKKELRIAVEVVPPKKEKEKKLTVTGKVDPAKIKAKLEEKTKR